MKKNNYEILVTFGDCKKVDGSKLARDVAIALSGINKKLNAKQFMTYSLDVNKK